MGCLPYCSQSPRLRRPCLLRRWRYPEEAEVGRLALEVRHRSGGAPPAPWRLELRCLHRWSCEERLLAGGDGDAEAGAPGRGRGLQAGRRLLRAQHGASRASRCRHRLSLGTSPFARPSGRSRRAARRSSGCSLALPWHWGPCRRAMLRRAHGACRVVRMGSRESTRPLVGVACASRARPPHFPTGCRASGPCPAHGQPNLPLMTATTPPSWRSRGGPQACACLSPKNAFGSAVRREAKDGWRRCHGR